ncbi:MAG: response regulator [Gammaproteobacteria bacterium]|nr:MAG: response regulator [Gammaproteobacteria bacterium]
MGKKKLLFADDSASMRKVLGMHMKMNGFDVTACADGAEALAKAQAERYDIIITDMNMPNMNGIEFIKGVKQTETNKFAPIIMLTTENAEDMRAEGQAAGAKVWLVKPFRPDQLLSVVKKVMDD